MSTLMMRLFLPGRHKSILCQAMNFAYARARWMFGKLVIGGNVVNLLSPVDDVASASRHKHIANRLKVSITLPFLA